MYCAALPFSLSGCFADYGGKQHMTRFFILPTLVVILLSTPVFAQRVIRGKLQPKPAAGAILLAIGESGESTSVSITKKKFRIKPPAKKSRLYILEDGQVTGQLVIARCKTKKNSRRLRCTARSKSQVYTLFKAGKNLGKLKKMGPAYVRKTVSLASVVRSAKTSATNFVPIGVQSNGLVVPSDTVTSSRFSLAVEPPNDVDRDGLVDAIDIDDDGDGIIDNYDTSSTTPPSQSFSVFSNLKLSMEDSLNLHATGLSTELVSDALANYQTLAIQVAGTEEETTELDCGSLSYCSAGGTGSIPPEGTADFPGLPGGAYDPDGDGHGTITRGPTGDFQLKTGASMADIQGGDILLQKISGSGGETTEVPGTLNFVFTSTPAMKSIAVNANPAQTIDYQAADRLGSLNNCVQVPATGNVSLTITGWRPQRLGVVSAGEATYMDLGHSMLTIDIPNAPAIAPSIGGAGPGNCAGEFYAENDTHLESASVGLQDVRGDIEASISNTYTFTIDVTGCLGEISWNSGERLQLDLQFRSNDGDNAAQKICVLRD